MRVVVERSFAGPAALGSSSEPAARFLEAHSVRHLRTFVSRDQRRIISLYEAPDADSVSLAQREAGLPFEALWCARQITYAAGDAAPGALPIVAERRLPRPFAEDEIRGIVEAKGWCLAQYGCRIVESYLSLDGTRMVCRFDAPDAESVRAAQRSAEVPLLAAWPASVLEAAPG